jgi:hypothetical protein
MQNNLLDFSLQFELFTQKLWNTLLCREFLTKSYRHLIYDNIEEDVPVVHDVISEWLPRMDSALLIQDDQGGLRSFLGADPLSAQKLGGLLPEKHHFEGSLVQSDEVCDFREVITRSLREKDISGSNIESWKRGLRFNLSALTRKCWIGRLLRPASLSIMGLNRVRSASFRHS